MALNKTQVKGLKEDEKPEQAYQPSRDEQVIGIYVKRRIQQLKDYRSSLGIEKDWAEAEIEVIPDPLKPITVGKRFEADQETGLRSRLVPIGDPSQQWRSQNSDPILLTKIHSALSIIIAQNPEGKGVPLSKQYEESTDIVYSLWKRNWEITNSRQVMVQFAFNLFVFGWSVGRSFPRLVKYNKRILTAVDDENPDNNKYEDVENVMFNDVWRQVLDPKCVWIDELTRPYDRFSMNDCYYEIDYSKDSAELEFGKYKNFELIKPSIKQSNTDSQDIKPTDDKEEMSRDDIITFGFYENRTRDIFVIREPKSGIIVYAGSLPNDDGILSIWHTPYVIKSATSPYGMPLWRIIKQKKSLYDKVMNMNMDQLVLSIMKMGFHTGSSLLKGDGSFSITRGKVEQIINGDIKWLDIPGPANDAVEWLKYIKAGIDDDSGITPTLEGSVTGKTLGEIIHAKEAALKRLNLPIENISDAIEQDYYLTASWMKQIYSKPEVKEFVSMQELVEYEKLTGMDRTKDAEGRPETFADINPETGEPEGNLTAHFLPQLALHLEDRDGKLFESNESKFFQIGRDIKAKSLDWRGVFKVIPKSLLAPSAELVKQRKNEIANFIFPLLQFPPELYAKPVGQLLKVNEEEPEDWLPDTWVAVLKGETDKPGLFTQAEQPPSLDQLFTKQSMQKMAGMGATEGQSVVPKGQLTTPSQSNIGGGGLFTPSR